GRAAAFARGQLQCHEHQESDYRQRAGIQGSGAAHHSARVEFDGGAGTARCRGRAGGRSVPLLHSKTPFIITKIFGSVKRILDDEVRLQVGPLEYQVLVPEFVRRQIQRHGGQELTLHTSDYLDGNPMQGRVVPRLIGFLSEAELEFFELFCTVDKVSTRKAMKALGRPIREMADAISRQDAKWLTSLPGIGTATAQQIVATLRRKVTKFALMTPAHEGSDAPPVATTVDGNLLEEAYQALLSVGHSPLEARDRLDKVLAGGRSHGSGEQNLLALLKIQQRQTIMLAYLSPPPRRDSSHPHAAFRAKNPRR